MNTNSSTWVGMGGFGLGLALFLWTCAAPGWLRADQIDMVNGDHYVGRVLSLTTNAVVLQSDILGTITLARDKVSSIALGANPSTNISRLATVAAKPRVPAAATAPAQDISAKLRQLRSDTNAVQQVETEYLAGASPEAKAKFNEMLNGLANGKLTVNDIRSEAKSAADQLRIAKRDLGEEAGDALDAYLSILDNFLKETPPSPGKNVQPATKIKPTSPEQD